MEDIERIAKFLRQNTNQSNFSRILFCFCFAIVAVLTREKLWTRKDTDILLESFQNSKE